GQLAGCELGLPLLAPPQQLLAARVEGSVQLGNEIQRLWRQHASECFAHSAKDLDAPRIMVRAHVQALPSIWLRISLGCEDTFRSQVTVAGNGSCDVRRTAKLKRAVYHRIFADYMAASSRTVTPAIGFGMGWRLGCAGSRLYGKAEGFVNAAQN